MPKTVQNLGLPRPLPPLEPGIVLNCFLEETILSNPGMSEPLRPPIQHRRREIRNLHRPRSIRVGDPQPVVAVSDLRPIRRPRQEVVDVRQRDFLVAIGVEDLQPDLRLDGHFEAVCGRPCDGGGLHHVFLQGKEHIGEHHALEAYGVHLLPDHENDLILHRRPGGTIGRRILVPFERVQFDWVLPAGIHKLDLPPGVGRLLDQHRQVLPIGRPLHAQRHGFTVVQHIVIVKCREQASQELDLALRAAIPPHDVQIAGVQVSNPFAIWRKGGVIAAGHKAQLSAVRSHRINARFVLDVCIKDQLPGVCQGPGGRSGEGWCRGLSGSGGRCGR